jgi:hypothetical protein
VSGRPHRVALGYLEEPDGSLIVSATEVASHWARNLLAEPRCTVTREGASAPFQARQLDEREHREAVSGLILKYGTPAERLGGGPSFRLRRAP